jgi:hypothetical protein
MLNSNLQGQKLSSRQVQSQACMIELPFVLELDENEQQERDGHHSRNHMGSTQESTHTLNCFLETPSELTSDISSTECSSDDLASDITDYSEESLLEASDASECDPLLLLIMAHLRHDITSRVLETVRTMLQSKEGQRTLTAGGDSSSTTSDSGLRGGTNTPNHQNQFANRGTKRRFDEDGSENSKGDDHDDKNGSSKSAITAMSLRFACPYFTRDSQRHSGRRSCRGPGWDTVHRVKYVTRHDSGIRYIE